MEVEEILSDEPLILIAEDSPMQAALLRSILELKPYKVLHARNGKEALELMHKHKPILLITDTAMPDMDGYQLCCKVKSDPLFSDVPVILLTYLFDPRDVIRGLQCGADNFINKPYDEEKLLSRIETILINRKLRQNGNSNNGIEIFFGGERYLITADRQQILALLLSTYETAIQKNEELVRARDQMYLLNGSLEEKVNERTAELTKEITERKRIEEELEESKRFIQRVADATPNLLFIYDIIEQRNVYANLQVSVILGYDPEDIRQMKSIVVQHLLHPDDLEQIYERNKRLIAEAKDNDIIESEFRMRHAKGEWRWIYSRETVFTRTADGRPKEILCAAQDITDRKLAEERINHLAYHDAITDLPNRILFEDRLKLALNIAQHNRDMLAVIFLNLDRFKNINDTLGHNVGDQLLRAVAKRLTRDVTGSETIAHFGGNEFAFIVTQLKELGEITKVIQHIQRAFHSPFNVDEHELYLTNSIGISIYPHDGKDASTLIKNAGAALLRAKDQGGNGCHFYTADMNSKALSRLEMENTLRHVLARGEFQIYYQPQLEVSSREIIGMEALLRWQHPRLGLINPSEFIPLAEATGLIVPISEWILRTVCLQYREWQRVGYRPPSVSVNISARHFQQSNVVELVTQILKETNVDPTMLKLEITESAVMKDPHQAILILEELKRRGVKISIDDFGTGYSSLNYLKRFPLDELKIDQSFVCDTTKDQNDAAIVMAIITLAHSLNLKVVAEGVETEEQLTFLRLLRCDKVQGYLVSKPVTHEEFAQNFLVKKVATNR
jgi:diguanylate cyclase (GGDEF)-like protein/PAS domain S-box-containing protein